MTSELTKKELCELLECAKTSKERNKAVKLLKKFDAVTNYENDEHGTKEKGLKRRRHFVYSAANTMS